MSYINIKVSFNRNFKNTLPDNLKIPKKYILLSLQLIKACMLKVTFKFKFWIKRENVIYLVQN